MANTWIRSAPTWVRTAAAALAALLTLLGFRALYLAPQQLALALVQSQIAGLQGTIRADLVSQRRVAQLRSAIRAEEQSPARQALPARADQADLLQLLFALSQQAGVQVLQVTFGSAQSLPHQAVVGYPLSLVVTGQAPGLLRFLAGIQTAARLMEVDTLLWSSAAVGAPIGSPIRSGCSPAPLWHPPALMRTGLCRPMTADGGSEIRHVPPTKMWVGGKENVGSGANPCRRMLPSLPGRSTGRGVWHAASGLGVGPGYGRSPSASRRGIRPRRGRGRLYPWQLNLYGE